MLKHISRAVPILALAMVVACVSCTPKGTPPTTPVLEQSTATAILPEPNGASKAEAEQQTAALAAQLANDECERLYNRRPFTSDSYPVRVTQDGYEWGQLDPAGYHGISAHVKLPRNLKDPEVTVYFSVDIGYSSDIGY